MSLVSPCSYHTDGVGPTGDRLDARLRRVLSIHFDPDRGTPYWLDRASQLGIDPRSDIRSVTDLDLLGTMCQMDLAQRPLTDYIPRRFHHQMHRFVIGQTGGTTGTTVWSAYREDEFAQAFITPFVKAAEHVGFPTGLPWLFVGPSGPHIIGKVVSHLAKAMHSADPYTIDFDPGWVRKLAAGSFAHKRYLEHLIEQALQILDTQPVGVLFTTPAVIESLGRSMSQSQRDAIKGIHLGGMAVTTDQLRSIYAIFSHATVLAGYGNTLMGCCLELAVSPRRDHLEYYPLGDRLILDVVDDTGKPVASGEQGRVRLTRLDESVLLVNLLERDLAQRIDPAPDAPAGFAHAGLRDPHPPVVTHQTAHTTGSLY